MKILKSTLILTCLIIASVSMYADELPDDVGALTQLVEKGNVEAMYKLGNLYYEGEGVNQNYEEAVKYFRMAANKGDADALDMLGDCYKNGEGVPQNYEEAVKYYKLAAEKKNKYSLNSLGLCYLNGTGVSKNYEEAKKYFKLAGENGNSSGYNNLGNSYYDGNGVPQNYEEAVKYYKLAADMDNSTSQNTLGLCYWEGTGVSKNYEEANKYFKLAGENGNSWGYNNLGNSYYNGNGVPQNYEEAVKYYKLAADMDNSSSQNNLGNCYWNGKGVTQNYEEAAKYYKLAGENGNAWGYYNLGDCYRNGKGVPHSYEEAVKYYKLAADNDVVDALYELGILYYLGFGVPRNYEEAIKYFKLYKDKSNKDVDPRLLKEEGMKAYYEGIMKIPGQPLDAVFTIMLQGDNATVKMMGAELKGPYQLSSAGNNVTLSINLSNGVKLVLKSTDKGDSFTGVYSPKPGMKADIWVLDQPHTYFASNLEKNVLQSIISSPDGYNAFAQLTIGNFDACVVAETTFTKDGRFSISFDNPKVQEMFKNFTGTYSISDDAKKLMLKTDNGVTMEGKIWNDGNFISIPVGSKGGMSMTLFLSR